MKDINGGKVPERCFYYLLDYHDRQKANKPRNGVLTLEHRYGKTSISYLNEEQFWDFFTRATQDDIQEYGTEA